MLRHLMFNGGGSSIYYTPYVLKAAARSTTEIYLYFLGVGADSYTIERATDSGFTANLTDLASEGYNGTDLTYLDTGLIIDTTYYYRVKAVKAGFTDSSWATANTKTISFTPLLWWEFTGVEYDATNDYGKTTTSAFDDAYSVVNVGGVDFNFDTTKGTLQVADNENSYVGFSNGNIDYWTSAQISLAGDFTWALRFKFLSTPSNHYLHSFTGSANDYIRFSSLSVIQFRIGGSILSCTFPAALVVGKWADVVIKRVGSTMYASTDGGATFSAGTAGATGTMDIDTMFASDRSSGLPMNATFKRIVLADSELNTAKLAQFFDYENQAAEIQDALDATIPTYGLTYSDLTSSYYHIDNTINAAGLAGSYRTRVLTLRDKTFILLHQLANTTYYLQDVLFVFDRTTGKISNRTDLGVPSNNTDVHNNGSIMRWGNRIQHLEMNVHYDQAISTYLVLKSIANNFNFSEVTQLPIGNDIVYGTAGRTQYEQPITINNITYMVAQEWNGTYAQYVSLFISYNGGLSWPVKYRLIDTAGASEFGYPTFVYSEDKLQVFVGWIAAAGRYRHQTYIKADPSTPYTWTNASGGFSQDVRNNNPINRTNSLASCRIGVDATAMAGNVKVGHAFQDPTTGEVCCIQGNGQDTALNLVRIQTDGTTTSQALNFGAHSIVTTWLASDGDNLPFAYRTAANEYTIIVHRTNGGLWEIVKFTTVDAGVNLTFDSAISGDNTKQHWRMFPAKNLTYADYKILDAIRNQTTHGDLFVREL